MEVRFEEREDALVVAVAGSIDALNAEDLEQAIEAKIAVGSVRIIADLSGVTFVSSTGLRALLVAVKRSRTEGGDFRIAAASGSVQQVLELSGFTSILKTFETVEQAVASFAE
jgi:anti-anti-sigma factor